ncbi:MAG TPA: AMP-binding protein [Bryobacteraceae bacterium]|nr:AMP-binding protein [Bryobacteraceae bacterium]
MGKIETQVEFAGQSDLPLERVYRWERERATETFLSQPYGGGKVREWTWAEAVDESRRVAGWLKARNWPPGSRVAILSKNCAWWILADLAVWMSGHVSVPVYPSLQPHSIRQILEHSGAIACFIGAAESKELAEGLPPDVCRVGFPGAAGDGILSWEALCESTLPLAGSPARSADDLATIIYTSGTTGTPKGVMHTFAAFSFNAKVLAEFVGLRADDRVLSYLPLAHIVERVGVELLAITVGLHVYFSEGVDTFVKDLQRARPTLFMSVPRLLLKFQQNVFARMSERRLKTLFRIPVVSRMVKRRILRALGLETVRYAACGSAPLPPETLRWYRELGLNLAEGYGMTETLITHLPASGTVRAGWVGAALPGVEARLGQQSELQIKSPMNMLGYYKDPEGTRASFLEDGFFHTGDVCEIASDGQLKIVGRIKEQFKTSKGKYVAPAPIENKLALDPNVDACCVMGAGMANPFAVVLISDAARVRCHDPRERAALENSLAAVLEETNRDLDPHERVAFLGIADGPWSVANGMLTPTLKLKRALVEARYQGLAEEWRKGNRPVVWESLP